MKRIGIISDTHSYRDDKIERYLSECDEIWHAGDIGDAALLDWLHSIGPKVRAVAGNIDHGEVRRRCKEIEIFRIEDVNVLMTHIGGYPGKWSPGMKKLLRENQIRLMVDGHSHLLRIMYDKELELLHINPGAAGRQGWQKVRTLVRLTIDGSDLRDAEVIELA